MTIQDVYNRQDASDMFFNHEGVCDAYSKALHSERWNDLQADFITNLVDDIGFTLEDATEIAIDFLNRV